jgi:putative DNA primase/helicase
LLGEAGSYSVAGGNDDEATDNSRIEPIKADDDPHRLARLFLSERYTRDPDYTLRYWHGQWWRWCDGAYRALEEDELHAELWAAIETEFNRLNRERLLDRKNRLGTGHSPCGPAPAALKVSNGVVQNVAGALMGLTSVASAVEQPSWLRDRDHGEPRNYLGTRNGLVNLDDLLGGKADVLSAHSPRWFSPVCLPYDYDPRASCPQWHAFLQNNLEGDQERIDLLQEWFGYCLTPDTSQQRFLLLEGEGSNGKSVVCAALTALLGDGNVAHVPLEMFGQRFALTQTLGKLANIASEVGELDRVAEGVLKSFTSGDRMMFDRKGIAPVEAMPTARLVLATNNRPRLSDRSTGVWRRLLLMPFRVEIPAHQRVYGMDKPAWWMDAGELPGIFNWAIEGLRRLRHQKRFTEPLICQDALHQYRVECNPARSFLEDNCVPSVLGHNVPAGQLYELYHDWCHRNGYQPLGAAAFGKEVVRVFPKVEKKRAKSGGNRVYVYQGLFHRGIAPLPPGSSSTSSVTGDGRVRGWFGRAGSAPADRPVGDPQGSVS